ncbi:MAG TPA: hypothetical protein DER17_02985 [Oscillibacter sp.]|jgi:LacI family transcriptional regulator|nr:hypothetical protein [Oscillibacter sp.]
MTIKDLAKLTNTSPATVSLALNGKAGVSGTTRERIIKAAEENGYILPKRTAALPSSIIRLVAVSKPNTSGIHNFRTTFFAEIINYIQTRCSELNYSMIYSMVPHSDFLQSILNLETIQPSCGIIVLGTYLESSEVPLLQQLPVPFVLLDRNCTIHNLNSVSINNFSGAYLAVEKLISCGHTRIGYISSSPNVYNLEERRSGFLSALRTHDLSLAPQDIIPTNSYSSDGVQRLKAALSDRSDIPTAFFCENDYTALSLVSALIQLGYSVPGDVSVIGFDDVPECSLTTPPLSTVHVDRQALATAAVDRLHLLMTSPNITSQSILVNVSIRMRASVAE